MIKKIAAAALAAMLAFATAEAAPEGELISDTIRININAGTMTINDEQPESAVSAYITDHGVAMTEFFTLVGALGAEASEADGKLTVTYEDVEMIYTPGSAYAVIAGSTIPMPEAPVRGENGIIMAPLRFVAESLGADVTYDGETGEIVIVSGGGIDEGINFKLLFKYAAKSKVGHSEEHWRFSKTDNFDMNDSFMYTGYQFAMEDIYITLKAEKNKNKTDADRLYALLQSETYGGYSYSRNMRVMYDKGRGEHKGVSYVYTKFRTVDAISEYYGYVTDEYVYYITIERGFESFAGAKDNPDVTAFLESLEFDYTGGDEENTVDLAKINPIEDGKEKKDEYTDGNYSWSIKLNGEWTVDEYYGFYNHVTVRCPSSVEAEEEDNDSLGLLYGSRGVHDACIYITTLSCIDGQSTADWAESRRKICEQTVNPEKRSVSAVTDTVINGRAAKTFETSESYGDNTDIYRYYYITEGNYRYELVLYYDKRDGEQAGFLESAEAVVQSFTPGEINYDEVGDALDADSVSDMLQIISEQECGDFTMQLPVGWNANEGVSGIGISDSMYYDSSVLEISTMFPQLMPMFISEMDGKGISVSKNSLAYYDDGLNKKLYTPEEYLRKMIAGMLNASSAYVKISMEKSPEKAQVMGMEGYTAEIYAESIETGRIYITYYCAPLNDEEVAVALKIYHENIKNTVYDAAMDKIIDSLRIKAK
ncbi:MAG: copper amine oxidase N-terminal domain-containing protein [Clostridia bacterium]|nr:copper amine oxidase N-terminal domain-containing protein [Clostridia bacterium]